MIEPIATPASLISALNTRYATKIFDPSKTIAPEIWEALEDSLVLAPSSFGLQPWRFLVVKTPELREQLVAKSWGQRQVADSSHFVVFTTAEEPGEDMIQELLADTAAARGQELAELEGYGNVIRGFAKAMTKEQKFDWSRRQAYIALGGFMTAAAALGVDTCPMEGFDPGAYDTLLGLEGTGWKTVVACAAGYRSAEDKYATAAKVRRGKDLVITSI